MLNQFIQQHRASFDHAEVPPTVWERIERCLNSTDELEQFVARHRSLFDAAVPTSSTKLPPNSPDELELFIHQNRWLFDSEQPTAQVWEKLDISNVLKQADLEHFIAENREQFDAEVPHQQNWQNIEKALSHRQNNPLHVSWVRHALRAAAAVVALFVCFLAGMKYATPNRHPVAAMSLSQVSNEYAELEGYFQRDIAGKELQLAQFAHHQQQVSEDLEQLDKIMQELRTELANVPPSNREQVVRAMIENYKAKSAILEKVLEHIHQQEQQQSNSKKHEVKNI